MGELVRVNDKFQVTIPVEVRTAAAIREGDYLEVSAVPDGVLLRPRRVVAVHYNRSMMFIRFVGPHLEYDDIVVASI